MFRMIVRHLINENSVNNLEEIDNFYKEIVIQLSKETQKQYCVNLVGRLEYDLTTITKKKELRRINIWISLAEQKLKELNCP